METAFAIAARPSRRRILRVPLLVYSIGHELQLLANRNPLAALSTQEFSQLPFSIKKESVSLAVLICSRPWSKRNRTEGVVFHVLWRWLNRNANFTQAIADFQAHRDEGSSMPRLSPPEERGRDLGGPHLARILNYANGDFDAPLALTQFRYFTDMEIKGECRVENASECQIRVEIAQHQADWEREQKEAKK